MMDNDDTLILGIGNTLLSDEGAGVHALNHLQSLAPDIPNLSFVDGGTLSFTLSALIEDCTNLIVFDAAELNLPPGTVYTFIGTAMDDYLGNTRHSAHEIGLLDLMDIARITGHLPENRALIGIQPEMMDWGTEPTPVVQNALDQAADEAITLIKQWQFIRNYNDTDQMEMFNTHY